MEVEGKDASCPHRSCDHVCSCRSFRPTVLTPLSSKYLFNLEEQKSRSRNCVAASINDMFDVSLRRRSSLRSPCIIFSLAELIVSVNFSCVCWLAAFSMKLAFGRRESSNENKPTAPRCDPTSECIRDNRKRRLKTEYSSTASDGSSWFMPRSSIQSTLSPSIETNLTSALAIDGHTTTTCLHKTCRYCKIDRASPVGVLVRAIISCHIGTKRCGLYCGPGVLTSTRTASSLTPDLDSISLVSLHFSQHRFLKGPSGR